MAINQDNLDAMVSQAKILREGEIFPVDTNKAAHYLKKAADRGKTNAMNSYAVMKKTGESMPIDTNEAVHYFKMAADKNHKYIFNALNIC